MASEDCREQSKPAVTVEEATICGGGTLKQLVVTTAAVRVAADNAGLLPAPPSATLIFASQPSKIVHNSRRNRPKEVGDQVYFLYV
jgi:hypothetical protein